MNSSFWKNKKVLITGHTGFKGSWLSIWLQELGAEVTGLALEPSTAPNLYSEANISSYIRSVVGDIRDLAVVTGVIKEFRPEIVFHLAAQALVGYSYNQPIETYQTNVMGTLNVLEAIRAEGSVRSAVMVTTDKCYDNKEWVWSYRENDALGGFDPYSSSKACAEILIDSYRRSYFQPNQNGYNTAAVASVRAGNVIGGGDWTVGRLIPDVIRSIKNKQKVILRNPHAVRPWQHVLEPIKGYLMLAEKLYNSGSEYTGAWNFGPLASDAQPVADVVKQIIDMWGTHAEWEVSSEPQPHEASILRLDCTKAITRLNWQASWTLNTALKKIVEWHSLHSAGESAHMLCLNQIKMYSEK